MNSRERILAAFDYEEPDRVPTFCQSMMPKFEQTLEEMWEDEIEDSDILLLGKNFTMFKKLGFDSSWGGISTGAWIPHEVMVANPLPKLKDTSLSVNVNGQVMKITKMDGFSYTWYYGPYLTSEELADEWYETYFNVKFDSNPSAIDDINKLLAGLIGDGSFVPTCGLHAVFEPVFEGLGPELFSRLIIKKPRKISKYFGYQGKLAVASARIVAQLDYDVYNLCDDSAYKNNPYISPKMHEKFIIPWYKKIVDEIHAVDKSKKVFFHSDGFTEPYFDGLIKAGFDGVESLEPGAGMNLKRLKERYGDRLCLIGNIDCSRLLPFGSKEDVVSAVKQCIKDAAAGGGYILSPCTDLTNACKVENVITMMDAVRKYGTYPINI
ncbi:MAG: uroporphyrinogen decarboxylase family protein [Promethearchaeota archaeon]